MVLDDDDELVVGKSLSRTTTQPPAATRTSPHTQHTQQRQQPSRNSPSRNGKASRQKVKAQQIFSQREQRSERSPNKTPQKLPPRERPIVNTQKLAQRLHHIRQDQERQALRAKSPLKDQTTPERLANDTGALVQSQSEPTLHQSSLQKPHARIAKPVERKKRKKKVRPDPEGAALDPAEMDELDKIINNNEPLFSDYGTDDDREEIGTSQSRTTGRPGFSIAAFAIGLGVNSNTMIKYTIIGTELQNIIRVSLKMVRYLHSFMHILNRRKVWLLLQML